MSKIRIKGWIPKLGPMAGSQGWFQVSGIILHLKIEPEDESLVMVLRLALKVGSQGWVLRCGLEATSLGSVLGLGPEFDSQG